MKMTNATAIENAIAILSTVEQDETVTKTVERLTAMHEALVRRAEAASSNEKTKAAAEKRKAENHAAREALVTAVRPAIRAVLTDKEKTAAQIYEDAKANLPADFNEKKVQYLLIHEMADEVVKHDNGRNSKTYTKKA